MFGRLVLHSRWTRSYFFFSFELSYLRAVHKGQDCQDLVGSQQAGQKALEVRTPLVQNGADEHGPHRGDITAEWAQIGRLSRFRGSFEVGEAGHTSRGVGATFGCPIASSPGFARGSAQA